jgi:hypothetical protein
MPHTYPAQAALKKMQYIRLDSIHPMYQYFTSQKQVPSIMNNGEHLNDKFETAYLVHGQNKHTLITAFSGMGP